MSLEGGVLLPGVQGETEASDVQVLREMFSGVVSQGAQIDTDALISDALDFIQNGATDSLRQLEKLFCQTSDEDEMFKEGSWVIVCQLLHKMRNDHVLHSQRRSSAVDAEVV